jgi:hypothetical protein
MRTDSQNVAQKVAAFFAKHGEALSRQGAVVGTFRKRSGRRTGPYFRLDAREGGRKLSVYLGMEGPLVVATRKRLAELQKPFRERLELAKLRRMICRELRVSRARSDNELKKVGLKQKGSEIRGFARMKKLRALAAPSATSRQPENEKLELSRSGDQQP